MLVGAALLPIRGILGSANCFGCCLAQNLSCLKRLAQCGESCAVERELLDNRFESFLLIVKSELFEASGAVW